MARSKPLGFLASAGSLFDDGVHFLLYGSLWPRGLLQLNDSLLTSGLLLDTGLARRLWGFLAYFGSQLLHSGLLVMDGSLFSLGFFS
jgi:hypothetical protein